MRSLLRKKRPTLEDVANAAGVAPMTVSRMINGHPYVTAETAKKIQEAIRALGYRPNHAARVLTGKHTRSIGLIVPDISDTFFSIVSHSVQEAARARNYLVWLAASGDNASVEAAQMESMTHHPVDGIVLVPANSRAPHLKSITAGSVPVVTIDRPIEVAATDSVAVENHDGAVMAVNHLVEHGYKKVACITTNSHLLTIQERIAGYHHALRHSKLSYTKEVDLKAETAKSLLTNLLSTRNRPDALFTVNNVSTIWVIEALQDLPLKMGKDIALAGFDDIDFFSLLTPAITAVRQPAAELGYVATRLLLERISGEFQGSSVRSILPVALTVRQSCGCKRHSS